MRRSLVPCLTIAVQAPDAAGVARASPASCGAAGLLAGALLAQSEGPSLEKLEKYRRDALVGRRILAARPRRRGRPSGLPRPRKGAAAPLPARRRKSGRQLVRGGAGLRRALPRRRAGPPRARRERPRDRRPADGDGRGRRRAPAPRGDRRITRTSGDRRRQLYGGVDRDPPRPAPSGARRTDRAGQRRAACPASRAGPPCCRRTASRPRS